VAAANRLIVQNRERCKKDCKPVTDELGELVIRGYRTAEIEARQVARAVATLIGRGQSPREIAVLYRTGTAGLGMQPGLQALNIPYEVRGAGDLWQSVAARLVVGALLYLREGESVEAMSRMGSGRRSDIVRSKLDPARAGGKLSFQAACRLVRDTVAGAVPARASDRDRGEWVAIVDAIIALASSCQSVDELVAKVAQQSASVQRAPENAVVLSTIHSAKGLEWDTVFIVGMEQGVLPHANNEDVEEERRVAYVALTRAKRRIGLTFANRRFGQPSTPSQFLDEIAGVGRRHCVWTNPQQRGSDEYLPLLSDAERRRLRNRAQPQHARRELPRNFGGGSDGRRAALPDSGQARLARNTYDGKPARHGLPWARDEDDRLRAAFDAGDAIAAIAAAHQRKISAITARLIRLGLITEDGIVQSG
jgi:DNA helicase-2/ATP-dependent DNA helicase PcrA